MPSLLISLAAGALQSWGLTAGFGWELQLAALAWLAWAGAHASQARAAARLGYAYGLGWFLAGIWWLYISMHIFGQMAAPLAALAVVLLSVYLALYPAAALTLARWISGPARGDAGSMSASAPLLHQWGAAAGRALVFAAAWGLAEWLRGWIFTGFPWLSTGYAQIEGPLAGYAAWTGVYGIGALAALAAALIAGMAPGGADAPDRAARAGLFGAAALVLLLGWGAGAVRFTQDTAAALRIRLLQGNVPQEMKFDVQKLSQVLQTNLKMLTAVPADLIVSSETALPILLDDLPPAMFDTLRAFSRDSGSHLLIGAAGIKLRQPGEAAQPKLTNSAFGFSPDLNFRYDKHHLVPFGEFVPYGFRWFVDAMVMPMGDFARGTAAQEPFEVKGERGVLRVGVNICYEDIFGAEIAHGLHAERQPAQILANMTNLAWFGDTVALDQHLQMARMRSLETQKPMVRATNTGATAVIGPDGKLQAALPHMTAGALTVSVRGTDGETPYVRWGDLPVLAACLLILALAFAVARLRSG
ncbi:MAG: apolipoprotein N-acyltransferase [Candidatus Protistobacter heckmanni]|nr:apolipoprotein N-acyltransferase [Candidatus Protistobacter heckmanni]